MTAPDLLAACERLDRLDDPNPKVASLIEVWLETTPLILVARHAEAVGRVRWLLCAFERLELLPLPEAALLRMARDMAGKTGSLSCPAPTSG